LLSFSRSRRSHHNQAHLHRPAVRLVVQLKPLHPHRMLSPRPDDVSFFVVMAAAGIPTRSHTNTSWICRDLAGPHPIPPWTLGPAAIRKGKPEASLIHQRHRPPRHRSLTAASPAVSTSPSRRPANSLARSPAIPGQHPWGPPRHDMHRLGDPRRAQHKTPH